MRILSLASVCLAASALALLLVGCDSSADDEVALAKLSDSCRINSDCGQLLVCVFERCHSQCESSRDCEDGARCVQSPQSRNICQLPDEQACGASGACPGEQVCGIDAECRDACTSNAECLTEQVCSAGTCADSVEVDADGQLEPADERPTTVATPCAFDSDCPGSEVCAAGACRVECERDAECKDTERCVEQVCEPLPVAQPCLRNSDCAADQVCERGECAAADPEVAPECRFDSDCQKAGQRCDGGQCACECATDADCSYAQSCADSCACVGGRVLDGDVRIQNERELELIRDVVEITGELELQMTGPAEYHLPNLRRLGSLSALGSSAIVWLEGLEEVVGSAHCFQDCRLPKLRKAAFLGFTSSSIINIDLPRLEAVDGVLQIASCRYLTQVRLPKLTRVKDFRLEGADSLGKLEAPALVSLETLSVNSNQVLELVSLPLAAPTFAVEVSYNKTLAALSLPSLERLESSLTLRSNPQLESAEFAGLTQANAIGLEATPKLRKLSLPALERVVVGLSLSLTSGPETLALPALTQAGSFTLSDTKNIKSIEAPLFVNGGDVVMEQTDIETIDLPLQTLTGQLTLDDNSRLTTLKLTSLTSSDRLTLSLLPALQDMNLSALETTNDILISKTGLTNLTSLHYGAGGSLKAAGILQITFNPALPVCAVGMLTSKLIGQGWNGMILAQDNLSCDCNGAACL